MQEAEVHWGIRTPRVYRFLPRKYVDAFFTNGSLRLSSFVTFSEHKDEQRLDGKEGTAHLVHRTSQNGGQTLIIEVQFGQDTYVLCGSMSPSKQLMADFGCDSAIVIHNTSGFLREVGKHIPSLRSAFEGPCSYQFRRILEKDLGWLNIGPDHDTDDLSKMNAAVLKQAYDQLATIDGAFLKHDHYRHQVEYRFLWMSNVPIKGYLDIKVPEARQFCVPWEDQGEVISF